MIHPPAKKTTFIYSLLVCDDNSHHHLPIQFYFSPTYPMGLLQQILVHTFVWHMILHQIPFLRQPSLIFTGHWLVHSQWLGCIRTWGFSVLCRDTSTYGQEELGLNSGVDGRPLYQLSRSTRKQMTRFLKMTDYSFKCCHKSITCWLLSQYYTYTNIVGKHVLMLYFF